MCKQLQIYVVENGWLRLSRVNSFVCASAVVAAPSVKAEFARLVITRCSSFPKGRNVNLANGWKQFLNICLYS